MADGLTDRQMLMITAAAAVFLCAVAGGIWLALDLAMG